MDQRVQSALNELKHSIRTHLLIMAGPTQQLCAFLIKVVDFMEDTDAERKLTEMEALSFNIIEGMALYVQRSIDERVEKAKAAGTPFPDAVQQASDEIIVMVGKTRNHVDKNQAKYAVLQTVGAALKTLGGVTKVQYPQFTDCSGNVL